MSEQSVSLRFDSFRSFLDECAGRISEEGIFLATEAVQPVGSTVAFDLGLDSDFPILRGTGEVLWVVEPNGGDSAPGMAVRYSETDDATAALVRKIVERRQAADESVFDLSPPATAAAAPVAELAPEEEPLSYATQAVATLTPEDVEAMAARAEGQAAEPEPPAEPESAEPAALEAEPAESAEAAVEEPAEVEPEEPEPLEPKTTQPVVPTPAPAAIPPYLEESISAQKRGSRRTLWTSLVLFALIAGVLFWQRDFLMDKLSGGAKAPEPAELPMTEVVEETVAEPGESEPVMADPVEIDPAEVVEAEAPAPSTPMSRIEEVQWLATDDGTVLRLLADGRVPPDSYSIERLVDPPRLVLKIDGVTAPLSTPNMAVGSEEVVGIRSALHGSAPATSLHVVVDLADPTAQVAGTEATDGMLQVRIASGAISP